MTGDRRSGAGWGGEVAGLAALVLVLLLLMPPHGVLLDNEETYFALAERAWSGAGSAQSAIFDASRHRLLSEAILGPLVHGIGFEAAQRVGRIAAALFYAAVLWRLCRSLSLTALDAVLLVIVYAALGQSLVGGEWLMRGYEAKVPAYALVILALALERRRGAEIPAALLFAAATWFHFLVGGFWFGAFILLRLMERERDARAAAATAALYAACVAPLVAMIAASRLATAVAPPDGVPSPDVIYTIIRAPHHAAPFASWDGFVSAWLPGLLVAAAMLGGAILVARTAPSPRLRSLARWIAVLHLYLFAALALSFVDRGEGRLGKFYPFRPSALILLLWLAMALAYADGVLAARARALKLLALALVAPPLLLGAAQSTVYAARLDAENEPEKRALADYLAARAAPDAVVLVDPAAELQFLDVERKTGHPALVLWKFDPTNDRDLVEWYRRMEFRRRVFDEGCRAAAGRRIGFLLTVPDRAGAIAARCGPVAFQSAHIALVRTLPGGESSSLSGGHPSSRPLRLCSSALPEPDAVIPAAARPPGAMCPPRKRSGCASPRRSLPCPKAG